MKVSCDQCQLVIIQGIPCHEKGCPYAWINPTTQKGYRRFCKWCGQPFIPIRKEQNFCDSECWNAYHGGSNARQ